MKKNSSSITVTVPVSFANGSVDRAAFNQQLEAMADAALEAAEAKAKQYDAKVTALLEANGGKALALSYLGEEVARSLYSEPKEIAGTRAEVEDFIRANKDRFSINTGRHGGVKLVTA